jgi:hypothetical protein
MNEDVSVKNIETGTNACFDSGWDVGLWIRAGTAL